MKQPFRVVRAKQARRSDAGVGDDTKLAEESAGSPMGHIPATDGPTSMRHGLLLGMVVLIALAAGLHVLGTLLISNAVVRAVTLQNPIAAVMLGVVLVVAMVKLTYGWAMLRRRKKHLARDRSPGPRSVRRE